MSYLKVMKGMMYHFTYIGLIIVGFCFSECKCDVMKTCDNFPACNCTEDKLECRGTFGESTEDFPTFPHLLRNITITDNNFTDKLQINLFGACRAGQSSQMLNLKYLDLSNNNITKIHGQTFHCVPNLETLILSHNNWHVNNHIATFSSLKSLKRLILENTFFEKINGTGHLAKLAKYLGVTELLHLEELNIARNEFFFMPNTTHNVLCSLKNLKVLDLSNNLFHDVTLCAEMNNLKVLNLSQNHLPWLGDELMENITRLKSLEKVFIDGNIFQCDCGMRNFYNWLKNDSLSISVQNKHELTCGISYNAVDEGRNIMELALNDLKCRQHTVSGTSSNTTGIVVGLIFGVIILMFVITLYYNRIIVKNTWKRLVGKPVTLALIPQSQGYSTVDRM